VLFALALAAWVWNPATPHQNPGRHGTDQPREQSLRESDQNLRTFFDSMATGLCRRLSERDPALQQRRCRDNWVFSRSELLGQNFIDLHPPHCSGKRQAILKAKAEGATIPCPLPLATRDGTLLPVETRVWHGQWDEKPCLFGLCKDLSKEQEALQRFNRLFNANPAPLALTDPVTGRFIEINDAFCLVTGYDREEVVGSTAEKLHLFVHPDRQQQATEGLTRTERIHDVELQVRCKSGELLDGLFSGEMIESQGQRYFLTVMIDQTAKKQAERSLRASENEYRRLFETMVDIFWRFDREGNIIGFRRPYADNRLSAEELLGTDIRSYAANPLPVTYRSQMLTSDFAEGFELAFTPRTAPRSGWPATPGLNGMQTVNLNARRGRPGHHRGPCGQDDPAAGICLPLGHYHQYRRRLVRLSRNLRTPLCPFHRLEQPDDRTHRLHHGNHQPLGLVPDSLPGSGCATTGESTDAKHAPGTDLCGEEWVITCVTVRSGYVRFSTSFVASEHVTPSSWMF
jgi:PAS domain S-box-containing protein